SPRLIHPIQARGLRARVRVQRVWLSWNVPARAMESALSVASSAPTAVLANRCTLPLASRGSEQRFARTAVGALLATLSALSIARAGTFHDSHTLWTRTLARNPRAWIGWLNLGEEELKAGRPAEAQVRFEQALAIDSTLHEGWNNLGAARMNQGDLGDAIQEFKKALVLHPSDLTAFENLGRAYLLSGRLPEAIDVLRR